MSTKNKDVFKLGFFFLSLSKRILILIQYYFGFIKYEGEELKTDPGGPWPGGSVVGASLYTPKVEGWPPARRMQVATGQCFSCWYFSLPTPHSLSLSLKSISTLSGED